MFIRAHKAARPRGALWCIHGFGESSLCFRDLFATDLAREFDLFAPDLPGFGVSPYQPATSDLRSAAMLLTNVILEVSPNTDRSLIAHSVGSIIGTWVADTLKDALLAYCSIEGNLTARDGYFSHLACEYDAAASFHQAFLQRIYALAKGDESLQRYFASICFAHPEALWAWGRSAAFHSQGDKPGYEFAALPCPKLYYWGAATTAGRTRQFLRAMAIPHQQFSSSSHWPMIVDPHQCSADLLRFFVSVHNDESI